MIRTEYNTDSAECTSTHADNADRVGGFERDDSARDSSHDTAGSGASRGAAHDETTNGSERCSRPEHDECTHGSPRAEKHRDTRDNDSPSPEYVEAYLLFEAWCEERGITPKDRSSFGEPLTRKQTAKKTGYAVPSIQFYYHDLGGRRTEFEQLRFLEVSTEDKPIKGAPKHRYWHPTDAVPQAYFPKMEGVDWNNIAAYSGVPLTVTQGASKAFVLTRACKRCVGISGVWMFESRRNGQFLLEDLARITWKGRQVEIVFDADIREKAGVRAACAALMRELLNRGAKPSSVILPGPEKGADDFLKVHTVEEYRELGREEFGTAEPLFKLNAEIGLI